MIESLNLSQFFIVFDGRGNKKMANEVKELKNAYKEEMFELATYAFNAKDTPERRERFQMIVENSWNYGYFDEEKRLTSQVMATPFSVTFYGKEYLMAGIGYVASYPEARGQGGINQIMERILKDCRERKVSLSYLAPFSYPFYRRYGYEQLFDKIHYHLDSRDVPNVKKTSGKMKRATFEQAKKVIEMIYRQMPENQRGGLSREDWWYTYKFKQKKENHYALYYDEIGEVKGYVVYQLTAPKFVVVEWGYLTHEAFSGIVRFVSSHSGAFDSFEYSCGYSGSDKNYLLKNPFAKMSITPYMMGRIVDVELFLNKYPFTEKNFSFALEITEDTYAKWNEGIFEIAVTNESINIKKVEETSLPVISGTIQSVTQLLMGYLKIEELAFFNQVILSTDSLLEIGKCFPSQQPILNDYF
jgi:predicted acetyltransferase